VFVALVVGTWWLLIKDSRGVEIATVLALPVTVLSLLVAILTVLPANVRTSSTAAAPWSGPHPMQNRPARRWQRTGALIGGAAVVIGGAAIVIGVVGVVALIIRPEPTSVTLAPPPASHVHTKTLRAADSAPLDIVAATDGTAWFTEFEGNKIGHVTAAGDIREFDKISDGARLVHPFAVVAGPAGDAWFTEGVPADDSRPSGNRIGHITADGVITTYPIPTANAGAVGITIRADGVVWFTEQRSGMIGRLNLDGSIDEFPIAGLESSWPDQITTGPDGNLWFTEFRANKIGQMTPNGYLVREYDISRGGTGPVDIVTRGNELWFTVIDGKKLGRLDSSSGVIQWLDVPTTGDHGPANLAEDHGHAGVWFTELSDAAVSYLGDAQPTKIDPRYTLPVGTQPVGIAVGPDGTVWFTDQLGNQIGSISTSLWHR
jgi:virginiamycin B lyase